MYVCSVAGGGLSLLTDAKAGFRGCGRPPYSGRQSILSLLQRAVRASTGLAWCYKACHCCHHQVQVPLPAPLIPGLLFSTRLRCRTSSSTAPFFFSSLALPDLDSPCGPPYAAVVLWCSLPPLSPGQTINLQRLPRARVSTSPRPLSPSHRRCLLYHDYRLPPSYAYVLKNV